jgi:glycolate oxidase FAD binding subunit
MQALREITEKANLQLPIDVAQSERATLGGVLATNVSGPRRFGHGTLRDYVIGISALNNEGQIFKAGGRVVKNVAGYDLCKLLVGSLGTLGVITQVTLKLRPIAEGQAIVALACDASNLECITNCLHATATRPTCLELLNQPAAHAVFAHAGLAAPESPWLALVGYEGNAAAVEWQVQQLVKEVGAKCSVQGRMDFTARPLCHALVEFASLADHGTSFKASVAPSATLAFCVEADRDPKRPALHIHLGNGIVHGHWAHDLTKEDAARMLTQWRERARQGQGTVVVPRCPSAWKMALDVWGPPRGDAWLMREIKRKFDPMNLFNPGRFVDGI